VMRPKNVKDVCVEAYLETAHLRQEPVFRYAEKSENFTLDVNGKNAMHIVDFGNHKGVVYAEKVYRHPIPDGWEIDVSRGDGGFDILETGNNILNMYVRISEGGGTVEAYGQVGWNGDLEFPAVGEGFRELANATLHIEVTVFLRSKEPISVNDIPTALFLTGRGVCCCPERPAWERFRKGIESVNWEFRLPTGFKTPVGGTTNVPIREANQMRKEIGRQLVRSVNHPDRYPAGIFAFAETQFVAQSIAAFLPSWGHPDNTSVAEIQGLDPEIREKVVRVAPRILRSKLLQMSIAEQVQRFGLSYEEAAKLRRASLGLEDLAPNSKHHLNRRERQRFEDKQ